MARLNTRGQGLWGVGGGGGSLFILLSQDGSGQATAIGAGIRAKICAKLGIPDSGEGSGWFWKDDDTIVGQFCGDPSSPSGCSIWEYHIPSDTVRGPFLQGANDGRGRGGTWAFWLGGAAPGYHADEQYLGVTSSTGFHSRYGALGGVFANGNLLVLKTYQQDVLGFEVIGTTGAKLRDVPTIGQVQGTTVRGNVGLWRDFGDMKLHALNAPDPVGTGLGAFASDKTGRLWITDGQNGVLIRAWDVNVGYWLSQDAFSFWQDIVSLPDGRLRIAASMNPGELPGAQRVWDLDPLTGAYTFNGQPGHADLVDADTGAPASLPAAPATPISTTHDASAAGASGPGVDLFPIVVGAAMLGGYYLINRGDL